ncbi:MAG: CHAT domain-containing protein [Candidatus Zixiibacteriota bacterium]|nr:MAG: CHAT domain-containing protein [candidate division Zixibacteria bacterium]
MMEKAARQFLRSGKLGKADPSDMARACDRIIRELTQQSLTEAVRNARAFVKQAMRHKGVLLQTAYRALGWALHVSGTYRQAEPAYLKARALALREPLVRARIDRILIDTYMYLGDFKEARRRARISLATFRRLGEDGEAAKTHANYGNLLHRQDRHREALKQYSLAGDYFRYRRDRLSLALCQYNQANTLVQLFDFSRANSLYKQAEKAFAEHGYDLYSNECRYGLAWLHMLEGDYHQALSMLADCEAHYRKAGQPKGEMLCQLDRAEAYLGLNLFTDARRAAHSAGKKSRRLGLDYESAKAELFVARAARAVGHQAEASRALGRARTGFGKVNNQGFLAAVELSDSLISAGKRTPIARIRRIRDKFSRAQLPLWEAICDLQILASRPDDNTTFQRLSRNAAVKTVPHLYAQWQTILGDRQAERGRMAEARRHWSQAVERLEAVRAKLPPVELRSAFLAHRNDPYLRLIASETAISPARASTWAERYKTAGLWRPPSENDISSNLRRQAETSLEQLARQVTTLSARISESAGTRTEGTSAVAGEIRRLQRQVRHNVAQLEYTLPPAKVRFDDLLKDIQAASIRQPIVQFHFEGNDLVAFIHERGETRHHRLGDGLRIVSDYLGCWQVQLNRALINGGKNLRSDLKEERHIFSDLAGWLWSPLEISNRDKRVLIIPDGKLTNLPWHALSTNGHPIIRDQHIIVAPSIRHHIRAAGLRIKSEQIRIFVGESQDLKHTREELSDLLNQASPNVTVFDPCLRRDWPDNTESKVWHYTGHARMRSDNPFYSSLSLSDGPIFAADFRLKQNKVGLAVLAACRTGQQTYIPGVESSGLVRSLLEMGARNVLASHWAVSDKSTARWMQLFYQNYLSGKSVPEAVSEAALAVREEFPSVHNWAAFSLFGA